MGLRAAARPNMEHQFDPVGFIEHQFCQVFFEKSTKSPQT
jgi:hypothetical protein